MRTINPILFVSAIFILILINRIYAIALPSKFYFSFSSFLIDNRELSKLPGLAVKISQPFIASFLIMLALQRSALFQRSLIGKAGTLSELVTDQGPLTLAFAAGFTAFLFAWPYILLWDLLIDPMLAPYRAIFLLSYLAYVVGFAFFALAGAEFAEAVSRRKPGQRFSMAAFMSSEYLRPISNTISGLVATGLSTFLASQVG